MTSRLNSGSMHVRFSDDARADLRAIQTYINQRNPVAAQRVIDAILLIAYQLESFPLLGRPGRVPGTREISVPQYPYFLVHTIADAFHLDVEAVLHGRRLYPPEPD